MPNEIKRQFELLQESYTPVNVIQYFDFLRTRPFGEVLENVSYVFTEPTKGVSYIRESIETLYPFPVDTLKEAATTMSEYYNKAYNGGYQNNEHLEAIRECVTFMNEKISDYEGNEVHYLREDTLKHLDMVFGPDLSIAVENIGSMAPDIVYSDEETIPVLKKKFHKEFSKHFVNTFMDDSEEINLESFNAMLRAGFAYDNLAEKEILTEGAVTKAAKKVAIAGDAAARKTANGLRRSGREAKRVKVIAKKIPGHFDKLADNTIGQIGKMDKAERRKRIIEGGFKFKLLKLIRNAILLGAAWAVSPALAAIGILTNLILDRQLDRKVRGELLDDLELELKMTREKIKDAESKGDSKKKYQLMRIENALERDIERVRYRLNTVKVSKKGVQV